MQGLDRLMIYLHIASPMVYGLLRVLFELMFSITLSVLIYLVHKRALTVRNFAFTMISSTLLHLYFSGSAADNLIAPIWDECLGAHRDSFEWLDSNQYAVLGLNKDQVLYPDIQIVVVLLGILCVPISLVIGYCLCKREVFFGGLKVSAFFLVAHVSSYWILTFPASHKIMFSYPYHFFYVLNNYLVLLSVILHMRERRVHETGEQSIKLEQINLKRTPILIICI
eukprot:TRINITY_DN6863_c0_g1_i2.p2 TRINITY_DN6863_c0_g1~~TRINITY_DN6863_c0_g1_i2.p2  ORF type:complete len:225 (+),score=-8.75 TRINITY_DN6863_c0_g1_i2:362-1036(+)